MAYSIAHEQAALGAALLDDAAWPHIVEIVTAGDFYRPAHQVIFAALADLAARGKALDAVTVAEQLERMGHYADGGGLAYLARLAMETASSTPSTVRSHAHRVAELARVRRIREAAARVAAGDNSALAELMALAA